jgi:hypothetical protein
MKEQDGLVPKSFTAHLSYIFLKLTLDLSFPWLASKLILVRVLPKEGVGEFSTYRVSMATLRDILLSFAFCLATLAGSLLSFGKKGNR